MISAIGYTCNYRNGQGVPADRGIGLEAQVAGLAIGLATR